MSRGHVNNNSSVRRNNVNPNAGVWSGWFPQGEAQPAGPRMSSRPQMGYNYGGETGGVTRYAGNVAGPLDNVGKQTSQMVKQAALTGFAVTGDVWPGPRSEHGGKAPESGPGFPDGSGAGNPATSRGQARAVGPTASSRAQVIRGEIQGAAQMAALNAGPRVHKMAPTKQMMPVGNTMETMTHRALGPGPSSQFGDNPAGDVRGELAEAAQLMGGKQVSMGGRGIDTSRPATTPGQRSDAQKARQRKAGGNMSNLPWNQ